MKKILICLLALQLSACAGLQNNIQSTIQTVVSPDTLDTIEAAYGSTLAVALSYRNLCERKVINKSCWITIAKLQPYESKAYNAFIVLKSFVRNNPNTDAVAYYQLAKDAIALFKTTSVQLGVK